MQFETLNPYQSGLQYRNMPEAIKEERRVKNNVKKFKGLLKDVPMIESL